MKAKDPDRLRALAKLGGAAVPAASRAFAASPALAVSAGRLGGTAKRGANK